MKNMLKLFISVFGFMLAPEAEFISAVTGEVLGRIKIDSKTMLSELYRKDFIQPEVYDPNKCIVLCIGAQMFYGPEALKVPKDDFTFTVLIQNKSLLQSYHIKPCGDERVVLWIPFLCNPATQDPYSLGILVQRDNLGIDTFRQYLQYDDPKDMMTFLIDMYTKEIFLFIGEGIAKFEIKCCNQIHVLEKRLVDLDKKSKRLHPNVSLTVNMIKQILDSYESGRDPNNAVEFKFVQLYANLEALEAELKAQENADESNPAE